MTKARKMPTLGRGLTELLKDTRESDLKREIKKLEDENDRLLRLVEKLTDALINK